MQKKLTKGNSSNYEIQLIVEEDEFQKAKKRMLKAFGKELKVPGFRAGHIPEHLVEQQINPEYLTVGTYEELIHNGLQEVLQENETIRFIGEPYDINHDHKDKKLTLTIKLDVFPEVEVNNEKWKKETMNKITPKVSKDEIDQAVINLKKNYAEYKDTDKIAEDTVSKVAIERLDKNGESKENGHIYVGEPEFEEFDFFKKNFVGKKKDEEFELTFKEKDFPPTTQPRNKDNAKDIKKVKFSIKDIKQIVLPEMDEETLKKLFGPQSEVKNEKELREFIEKSISDNKLEQELIQEIEKYLKNIQEQSFGIVIPNTLIHEEHKVRVKNLEQRFGSAERVEQYFQQLGEEKTKAFLDDIKNAATQSLEKFFVLQKVCDLLELSVDRNDNQGLNAEKLLYAKLTGEELTKTDDKDTKKETKKTNTKKTTEKKATAKKTTKSK